MRSAIVGAVSGCAAALVLLFVPLAALAQEPLPPAPPIYSAPFQMRPAVAGNAVRIDNSLMVADSGIGHATTLTAAYKVWDELAPLVRLGFMTASPDDPMLEGGAAFVNPLLGALYTPKLGSMFRLAPFVAFGIPWLSGGGGDSPSAGAALATQAGNQSRNMFEGAMALVNYLPIITGCDVALIHGGLTVQASLTIVQYLRARGPEMNAAGATVPSYMLNSFWMLYAGYAIVPMLSVGVELRHQQWLHNDGIPTSDARRNQTSVGGGVRLRIKLSDTQTIPIGLAYSRGADDPLAAAHANNFWLDFAFTWR